MEEKKLAAKIKLMGKRTNGLVVEMGESWFKALESEFTKPYFEQVDNFRLRSWRIKIIDIDIN